MAGSARMCCWTSDEARGAIRRVEAGLVHGEAVEARRRRRLLLVLFRRTAIAMATSGGCRRVLRRCWCCWMLAEDCEAAGRPLQNFAEESSEVQGGGSCRYCCWALE